MVRQRHEPERVAEAIDYKLQGHSYALIAEQMNITVAQAVGLVHAGLAETVHDDSYEQLALDLQRVEQMLSAIYPQATQGGIDAVNAVVTLRRERDELRRRWDRHDSFRRLAEDE